MKKTLLMFALSLLMFSSAYSQESEKTHYIEYIEILQESKYDIHQLQDFPKFSYQSSKDKNLAELRKRYKLDSVAGKGTDISKAINLLQWMHKAVPHEDEYNHKLLTAKNIIETYREKGIAQGCYPLAIAMNEIFLSMGFQSRVVICFPADFDHPNGGHVINSVYIPSLLKWIWMDPQFNAYLKDEKGMFLSIPEVREKVIGGQSVFLNPNADYHGELTDINYYLYEFMIEHLYRFISPADSKYNSETREKGKVISYIELLPSNSKVPTSGTFESHTEANGQIITYHTTNPVAFWKLPY